MRSKAVKLLCYNVRMWHVRAVFCSGSLLGIALMFSSPVSGSETMTREQRQPCVTAQACFELRDLDTVVTRFPNSIWASRAHFVIGTQLIEHGDPAGRSSLEHLSDKLPFVADYIQWFFAKSFFP